MDAETEGKRRADEPMDGASEKVDVDMEDAGALAGAGLSLADELSELVFNELAATLPNVKRGGMKRLRIDEAAAEREKNIDSQLLRVNSRINIAYKLEDEEEFKFAELAVNHAASRARDRLAPPTTALDSKVRARLQAAFKQPYVGNTHFKFHGYLARCWHSYIAKRNGYTSPYAPLVQSSGFGKSRLLRELAGVTKDDTAMPWTKLTDSDSKISMRVLYVCARSVPKSSGFPVATPTLTKWFFSENHTVEVMTERLLTTFKYAQQHWETVGNEWFELFSDLSADESVGAAIAATPQAANLSEDGSPLNRLLVLVVDEARTLFDLKDAHGVDFFRLLRRALTAANDELDTLRYGGGIFAVLVDTNSKVHDFAPPQENDPSSRKTKHKGATALFPPFVLTHTMDVFCRTPKSLTPDPNTGSAPTGTHAGTPPAVPNSESPPAAPFDYKASVTRDDPEDEWAALISMGRPLWKSYVHKEDSPKVQKGLISKLAASKLLLGQPPDLETSYNESTMFGVAALLCRLGLRPHSSSALSSRVVADFMGVLSYVTFTNDSHITSYPSEPVLAFGAARLWYQLQPAALEKYLLPRFQEMLMQRLVDIGDIGEVVARIFLLLAMDATVMRWSEGPKVPKENFIFSGQFCTVRQFLDELGGTSPVLEGTNRATVTAAQKADYETWMDVWKDWKVGFSQFEDLPEEPSEEMLWLLLGRRAAGVLRRHQRGADLVIPIFSGDSVSFILVQVKNRVKDKEYPASATTDLLPRNVFKETNPLLEKLPRDMIRLYITLREEATADEPAQMYVVTTRRTSARVGAHQGDSYREKPTYALCLRGVCKPSPEADADADADAALRPWSFLPSGLSRCLEQIVNAAWWDMKERVLSDVKRRDESAFGELLSVLSEDNLMEAVECSQPIVLRDGKHTPQSSWGTKRKR